MLPLSWTKELEKLWRCFYWFMLTFFFGLLLEIFLLYLVGFIRIDKPFQIDEDFFTNGVLLFFSTVIVSSLTIDRHLSPKISHHSYDGIMFYGLPAVVIFLCALLFVVSYKETPDVVYFHRLVIAELAIFVFSSIYAIILKYLTLDE